MALLGRLPDAESPARHGPLAQGAGGRRIYMHVLTFRWLAATRPERAVAVVSPLLAASALKRVHHLMQDELLPLRHLTPQAARRVQEMLGSRYGKVLTGLLGTLGWAPRDPKRRYDILPVLAEGEQICASCFDGGYYTFATTEDAARRMFADAVPMRSLRAQAGRGGTDQELTIISGRAVVWLDVGRGHGIGRRPLFLRELDAPVELHAHDTAPAVAAAARGLRRDFAHLDLDQVVAPSVSIALREAWNDALAALEEVGFG
ncbi:MAG: hypothetical protein IT538_10435 [Variibacter sp.]|nr:hypothetical protein [Variibacter sp.]